MHIDLKDKLLECFDEVSVNLRHYSEKIGDVYIIKVINGDKYAEGAFLSKYINDIEGLKEKLKQNLVKY